jgi:nicotinamide-nucleotide amidase
MHAPSDDELQLQAERLGASLRDTKQMLVTAESCTGGWIAKTVTDVAGSSDWFDCGLAAYSYEAKQRCWACAPKRWNTWCGQPGNRGRDGVGCPGAFRFDGRGCR